MFALLMIFVCQSCTRRHKRPRRRQKDLMATAVARLPSRTKPSPIYTPIYYTKLKDGKLQELVLSIEGSLPDTLIEELAVAKEKSGREALKSARHYQHLDAQISNDDEETTEDEAVDSLEAQISNMAIQIPAIDISDVPAAMTVDRIEFRRGCQCGCHEKLHVGR